MKVQLVPKKPWLIKNQPNIPGGKGLLIQIKRDDDTTNMTQTVTSHERSCRTNTCPSGRLEAGDAPPRDELLHMFASWLVGWSHWGIVRFGDSFFVTTSLSDYSARRPSHQLLFDALFARPRTQGCRRPDITHRCCSCRLTSAQQDSSGHACHNTMGCRVRRQLSDISCKIRHL